MIEVAIAKTKYISILVVVTILTSLALPGLVAAQNNVNTDLSYCFQIDNISQYHDYVFLFSDGLPWSARVINQNDCVAFYYQGTPKIIAIPKSSFNKTDLGSNFNSSSALAAEYTFNHPVNSSEPFTDVEKIVDVLTIGTLENGQFKINPVEVNYVYRDGPDKVADFSGGSRPSAARNSIDFALVGLGAGVIVLLVLVVVIARRRHKVNKFKSTASKPISGNLRIRKLAK